MKRSLAALSAATLTLAIGGNAQAVLLSDLIGQNGSLTIGDKSFSNFQEIFSDASDPGLVLDPANVDVTAIGDNPLNYGLEFTILNDALEVAGDGLFAYIDYTFGFQVEALDPGMAITGATLGLDATLDQVQDGTNDLGAFIRETVGTVIGLDDLADLGAELSILDDAPLGTGEASGVFGGVSSLWVTKNLFVWAADDTDVASLTSFTQRFPQSAVGMPEPATAVLFGIGLLGAGLARRRMD